MYIGDSVRQVAPRTFDDAISVRNQNRLHLIHTCQRLMTLELSPFMPLKFQKLSNNQLMSNQVYFHNLQNKVMMITYVSVKETWHIGIRNLPTYDAMCCNSFFTATFAHESITVYTSRKFIAVTDSISGLKQQIITWYISNVLQAPDRSPPGAN